MIEEAMEREPTAGREAPDSAGPRAWLLAVWLLATVLVIANVALLRGTVAPKWDADDFFAPYFTLVADHARAGRVLLWDPWTSGGAPDFADPQLGAFSPVTVLVGWVTGGSEVGFRVYWLLLWFSGPAGMVLLARHVRAPAWGAAVVAIGFAFSGFYTGHAEHTSLLYPIAFLPFIVWRLDVALTSWRLWPAVEAGALWGVSALGAYPLLTILNGAFSLLWALGRWGWPERTDEFGVGLSDSTPPGKPAPPFRFTLLAAAIVSIVGLVILAPPYVGLFTEAVGYTDRVGVLPRAVAVESNALHPGALSTFASPYISTLKLPRTNRTLWQVTDISTTSLYMGAPVTVLAALALVARPRSRWRWWLAAVGLFFLASALGQHLPLRGWLYDLVPPMRYFRHPGFFRVYAMAVAALLALLATRDLHSARSGASESLRKTFVATAIAAAATAIGMFAAVLSRVDTVGSDLPRAVLHLGLAWLGTVAVSVLVLVSGRTGLLPVLVTGLAIADAALTIGLAAPTVYETGRSRKIWDTINASRSAALDLTPRGLARELRPPRWIGGHPNNKNLPLKIPTLENFVAFGNRFHRDFATRTILAGMATGEQRIWFAGDAPSVAATDAVYAAFVRRTEAIGAPILVVHRRREMSRIHPAAQTGSDDREHSELVSRVGAARPIAARLLVYQPNRLELEVVSSDAGWLLVTDRWAPGWRAAVNGMPTEVWGGNFIFRAVPVQAGMNQVSFWYHPAGWPGVLLLSWGASLVVLAGSLVISRRTVHLVAA